MQRKLPPGDDPLKLFALNVDVEKCNSEHLLQMPGNYDIGDGFHVTIMRC